MRHEDQLNKIDANQVFFFGIIIMTATSSDVVHGCWHNTIIIITYIIYMIHAHNSNAVRNYCIEKLGTQNKKNRRRIQYRKPYVVAVGLLSELSSSMSKPA